LYRISKSVRQLTINNITVNRKRFTGLTDRGEYGQAVQERRGYIPFESAVA